MTTILGIETSCDDTAAAVVVDGRHIVSSLVASQEAIHARFGGVVPEVASRQHLLQIVPLVEEALRRASLAPQDLDGIAVTVGPGLAGSLLVGVNLAKGLALAWKCPVVGVNHLESHIYANWLVESAEPPPFPLLALIASGGHTDLILMRDHGSYRRLGATRDDAAGEAFDKVSRLLGLGYPGGPAIEQAAAQAEGPWPKLPRPWLRGSDDFSFSGLKTAVLRLVEARRPLSASSRSGPSPSAVSGLGRPEALGLAAAFQEAVVEVLAQKTVAAAQRRRVRAIVLAGGVSANKALRQALAELSPLPLFIPPPSLCTDNAAMVAATGYYGLLRGATAPWELDIRPNLRLG